MSEVAINPYQTPISDLSAGQMEKGQVIKFKRFSAWWVFLLTLVTGGLYGMYWMYSRAIEVNQYHEKKISKPLLFLFLGSFVASVALVPFETNEQMMMASMAVTSIYFVLYLIVLFKIRNRLRDIISQTASWEYNVSIFLTFFLWAIYLQFKINQFVDECGNVEKS
ncbi:DUF4234 domain-containing protein [Pseudomonadota bacterium]